MHRKWLRRLIVGILVYLLLWGITWRFAPSHVNKYFVSNVAPTTIKGKQVPYEIRTGCKFTGEGLSFLPDPVPEKIPWYCIGRPLIPALFVVVVEVAWLGGGTFEAGAGRVIFIWTPWRLYTIDDKIIWVS